MFICCHKIAEPVFKKTTKTSTSSVTIKNITKNTNLPGGRTVSYGYDAAGANKLLNQEADVIKEG
jgi:hypothetical protein